MFIDDVYSIHIVMLLAICHLEIVELSKLFLDSCLDINAVLVYATVLIEGKYWFACTYLMISRTPRHCSINSVFSVRYKYCQ